MYVCSPRFWKELRNDPKAIVDTLEERRSRVAGPAALFLVFCRVVFSEYMLNHCVMRASSLAFALFLTIIPLLASMTFLLPDIEQIEALLAQLLPYTPREVLDTIGSFLQNAHKLRGVGVGFLVFLSVGLFGTVEESMNHIWKVKHSRSFFSRLRSFTMVMVYSPVLFFASFRFRSSLWLNFISDRVFLFEYLPFLLTILAFTSLIWFTPNTRVNNRSAFLGGLLAAILFELERRGFGSYVRASIQMETIYGAFGILLFFLISLFFVSIFVLFGAQAAYCHQNFRPLLRAKKRWDRRVGDYKTYLTLRILLDTISAFMKEQPPPHLEYFTRKYELTDAQALGIIRWLKHEGLLHCLTAKEGYVPAADFSQRRVRDILNAVEDQNRRVPTTPRDGARDYLSGLLSSMKSAASPDIDDLTFSSLIEAIEGGTATDSRHRTDSAGKNGQKKTL